MPALVPELVNAAMEPSTSPSDLLRQALVVARRLAVPELTDWISSELKGYKSDDVPEYRRVRARFMGLDEKDNLIQFPTSPEMIELFSNFAVRDSVPLLMSYAQDKITIYSVPTSIDERFTQRAYEKYRFRMHPVRVLSDIQQQGILEQVKTRVLEWALDLEAKGVLGEGMTFTPQEKQTVQEQHYHFGDVSGSQIQIGSNGSNQTQTQTGGDTAALSALIEVLREVIQQERLEAEAREELRAELMTLQAQAASPKPKWAIIKATVGSIKAVLENAAGGVLSAKALPYLTALL